MPLARIGPIVDPHSMSLRTTNSCVGMLCLWASSLHHKRQDVSTPWDQWMGHTTWSWTKSSYAGRLCVWTDSQQRKAHCQHYLAAGMQPHSMLLHTLSALLKQTPRKNGRVGASHTARLCKRETHPLCLHV